MCGFGAALGIAAALYQKSRTGIVGRPRTSLSALTGLAQIPFCYDYADRGPFDEPSGRETKGYNALSRLYETASGDHLLLCASEADLPRFGKVEGLRGIVEMATSDREAYLAGAFLTAPAETWQERLQQADIGVSLCENIETIRGRSARIADGAPGIDRGSYSFSIFPNHPCGHTVTQLDPFAIRPVVGKVTAVAPAEKYGASTRAVLRTLNYTEAEIDRLIAAGAISETWSEEYLPS
jgi:crotonobetainyl-CoA:carnitine CoA-transferase CaiB-like acyl-CoA transferase